MRADSAAMRPYERAYEEFRAVESAENAFDLQVSSIRMWPRIRWSVFRAILERTDIFERSQTRHTVGSSAIEKAKTAFRWAKNTINRGPLLVGQHDVFVSGHQRRKRLADGRWIDVYTDPLYLSLDFDAVHFELPYGGDHLRPAVTPNLRYLDIVRLVSNLQETAGIGGVSLSPTERAQVTALETALEDRFGVSVDLQTRIRTDLSERQRTLWLYRRLVNRVDPDVALVLSALGKRNLIEALKDYSVPVVELQHGIGLHTKYEMGHSVPTGTAERYYPDFIFVWGDYWKRPDNLPIDGDRVYVTGFPYLQRQHERYADVASRDQLLFISQGQIGKRLSKAAAALADRDPDYDIVYKIHPGDYGRWEDTYPWLAESDVRVVEEAPLYELFARSRAQVGVSSTALFEGLTFDLDTYLFDLPSIEYNYPLLDEDGITLVSDAEELPRTLSKRAPSVPTEQFFADDPIERFEVALADVRTRTEAWGGGAD